MAANAHQHGAIGIGTSAKRRRANDTKPGQDASPVLTRPIMPATEGNGMRIQARGACLERRLPVNQAT
jgi:hypothetical protein